MSQETLGGFVFFGLLFAVVGVIAFALTWHDGWRPHFMRVRHGRSLRLLGVDQGMCRDGRYDEAVTDCGRCWEHCPRCARREAAKPETRTAALEREIAALEAQS